MMKITFAAVLVAASLSVPAQDEPLLRDEWPSSPEEYAEYGRDPYWLDFRMFCEPAPVVEGRLIDEHGKIPIWHGLTPLKGDLARLYIGKGGGWTFGLALAIDPGMLCMFVGGSVSRGAMPGDPLPRLPAPIPDTQPGEPRTRELPPGVL